MSAFRNVSIKRKLILITMLTSGVALFVTSVMFVVYDVVSFRRAIVRDMTVLANIVGINSSASLIFDDRAASEETMAALRAEEHVVAASIYDRNGNTFAVYTRQGETRNLPFRAPAAGARFEDGFLVVAQSIQLDGEFLGTAYVQADLDEMRARLRRYAGIVALVMLGSLVVALVLSSRLQRVISEPILGLARVARDVSMKRDYSVRARKRGDDEIGTLIDGFNDMLTQIEARETALRQRGEELAAANRELESFSYSVSHDLRVPVRAVNGLSRVLLDEHAQHLDPEGIRILGLMRESAERMRHLIDDLLEFSRLGRRRIDKKPIDMTSLAREVADELLATEPERRVEVSIDALPPAFGDPAMIRQVLVNLLSNAFKFTRSADPARVTVGSSTQNGATAFFVRDNGEGFDMKYADKLFAVFQRLHSPKEYEGTGVGLAIVHRIIERHDGRISGMARPGAGATFTFTLPTNS